MFCQVCSSTLKAGDLYCSSCGAVVPDHLSRPRADVQIAGERKYLTVLCVDLQRSTDLISDLDPEAAISRLEPALNAMRSHLKTTHLNPAGSSRNLAAGVSRSRPGNLLGLTGCPLPASR